MYFGVQDLLQRFTLRSDVFSVWTTRWSLPWSGVFYFYVLPSFVGYFESTLSRSLLLCTLKLPLFRLHFLNEGTHKLSKLVGFE